MRSIVIMFLAVCLSACSVGYHSVEQHSWTDEEKAVALCGMGYRKVDDKVASNYIESVKQDQSLSLAEKDQRILLYHHCVETVLSDIKADRRVEP